MIHHNLHGETRAHRVGVQKENLEYTYLHWVTRTVSSKYYFREYHKQLDFKDYRPIGPTLLVEWGDE